jgi:pimeloyl-ACP methyl ester carboxylesterase
MPAHQSESRFITAPDGLRLHVREHGDPRSHRLPVMCLPGLSRTTEDFDVLAAALAADAAAPRRVLALDYRGRGLSDYDRNPANYAIPVELADVIAVLVACVYAFYRRLVQKPPRLEHNREAILILALGTWLGFAGAGRAHQRRHPRPTIAGALGITRITRARGPSPARKRAIGIPAAIEMNRRSCAAILRTTGADLPPARLVTPLASARIASLR